MDNKIKNMLERMAHFDNNILIKLFEKIFFFFSPVTLAIIVLITSWIVNYNRKRARMIKLVEKIPGPPSLPLIGS